MKNGRTYVCPACSATGMQTFLLVEGMPVHQNLLMETREAALHCRRGSVELSYCPTCGFIANTAFEPELLQYSPQYENTQSCSPVFSDYMSDLAHTLIERYDLHNKTLIEIGCGKGEFLKMLCRLGPNRGIGFDTSYIETDDAPENVTFVQDFYSERYTDYLGDMIYARHVLEHVQHPAQLVTTLRSSIGQRRDVVVFFEMPNVTWILQNVTFWDVFYEHCSYFGLGSLANMFERCGFEVQRVTEAFGGQYLWLEATPRIMQLPAKTDWPETPEHVQQAVSYFVRHYQGRLDDVRRQLLGDPDAGDGRCVIWGAGAKGVTILNSLGISVDRIEYVVDINPRKQGKFIAGTGQQIVAPEFLEKYQPHKLCVVNPNYLDEVREAVSHLQLDVEIISL